jgi:hypothetical protein
MSISSGSGADNRAVGGAVRVVPVTVGTTFTGENAQQDHDHEIHVWSNPKQSPPSALTDVVPMFRRYRHSGPEEERSNDDGKAKNRQVGQRESDTAYCQQYAEKYAWQDQE